MAEIIHRELIYFWYYFDAQFRQISLYWLIGILTGSLISVFLKNYIHHFMSRLQNHTAGILGIIPASLLGIASPLCMYGTIPIAASFAQSGVREEWLASFMMSSILLNPQLFLYSFALGSDIAIMRLIAAFVGGCLAGLLLRIFYKNHKNPKKQNFYSFSRFELPKNRDTDPNVLLRLIKNIWRNVKVTFPYFLAGIVLSVLYQRYIPSQWIVTLFGNNRGFGTLMAAGLGIPAYTCGGGTIPLLLTWLAEGMSIGSALSFMIAGQAVKLTNVGAVKTVLGTRNFIIYSVFSILFATLTGTLINAFYKLN